MSVIFMFFVIYVWKESNMCWYMCPVWECMCVYVYIFTHTRTHTHTHTHMFKHVHAGGFNWKLNPVRFMALHILFYMWSKVY